MDSFQSVNTSSLENSFCQQMNQAENSVCFKCYSDRFSKMRPSLEKRLIENSQVLSSRLLEPKEIPFFNARYVRFNSFGEIINEIHYLNLLRIAKANPHTKFGLWTKRSNIVMMHSKAKNIKYIYSAPSVNVFKVSKTKLNWFDKVFVVEKKDNPKINCKGKCIDCLLCYTDNDTKFIYEKIK